MVVGLSLSLGLLLARLPLRLGWLCSAASEPVELVTPGRRGPRALRSAAPSWAACLPSVFTAASTRGLRTAAGVFHDLHERRRCTYGRDRNYRPEAKTHKAIIARLKTPRTELRYHYAD